MDELKNIPVRTVNALVHANSVQRRIRAAAAAREGRSKFSFPVMGVTCQWILITGNNKENLEHLSIRLHEPH